MPLLDTLEQSLKRRQEKGMLRRLTSFQPTTIAPGHDQNGAGPGPSTIAKALARMADFSSNDYLSIATSDSLKQSFLHRASGARIGGSTGSRLLDGNNGGEMDELEQRLCRYFDSPHALLCPSGWEANVSLFSTLPQPDDLIIYDSLIHASVHDGLRRSRASSVPFEHNNVDHFGQVLRKHIPSLPSTANVFLAVETLYSMDGDFAPLSALLDEARAYIPSGSGRFFAFVDEAHSSGLYGAQGSGLSCEWELQNDPDLIRVCTFGKGFGASGAAILCQSELVRQYLINYARPLIFSTAMPHAGLVLVHAALDVLESAEGDQRRRRLRSNCAHLRQELQQALKEQGCYREVDGLLSLDREPEKHHSLDHRPSSRDQHRLGGQDQSSMVRAVCNAANLASDRSDPGPSPIMPLLTSHTDTRPLATYLQQRGFLVRPITYPTVPLGKDRIRICVHADNTAQEIQALAYAVKEWIVEHSSMLSEETRTTTRANVSSQKQHGSKL